MEEVEKSTRERGKGDAGRCTKQASKRAYPKKRRTHNKGGGLKKSGQHKSSQAVSKVASKKSKGSKHLENGTFKVLGFLI